MATLNRQKPQEEHKGQDGKGFYSNLISGQLNSHSSLLWQLVFTNASVTEWTINPYENDLFYSSYEVLGIPTHYTEVGKICVVIHGVKMVIN